MRRPQRAVDRPLDLLFAAPSHMAVLRALAEYAEGLSGRELGRVTGLTHQAGRMAVARLDALGVIRRDEAGPRVRLRLDEGNALVRTVVLPMVAAERALLSAAERRRHEAFLARARAVMGRS